MSAIPTENHEKLLTWCVITAIAPLTGRMRRHHRGPVLDRAAAARPNCPASTSCRGTHGPDQARPDPATSRPPTAPRPPTPRPATWGPPPTWRARRCRHRRRLRRRRPLSTGWLTDWTHRRRHRRPPAPLAGRIGGFAPGFAYLVDGDPRLQVPRRRAPNRGPRRCGRAGR